MPVSARRAQPLYLRQRAHGAPRALSFQVPPALTHVAPVTLIADTPGGVRTVIEAGTVLRDATAEELRVIGRIRDVCTLTDDGKLDEAAALIDEIERVMGRGFTETTRMRAMVHFERPGPTEWPTSNGYIATLITLPAGTVLREARAEDIAAAHEQRREAAPDVFEPTPEEVASCAVLAEVAGMTEREAALVLARRVMSTRLTNNELSKANGELREEVEQAHKSAVSYPAFGKPQRPRVGPWRDVENGWVRFDRRGHGAGLVAREEDGRLSWTALRPFDRPAEDIAATPDAARDAVDAVLATWADLDGVPAPDALTQARALLQRARIRLVDEPDAAKLSAEIDAFLAGLPVTASSPDRRLVCGDCGSIGSTVCYPKLDAEGYIVDAFVCFKCVDTADHPGRRDVNATLDGFLAKGVRFRPR